VTGEGRVECLEECRDDLGAGEGFLDNGCGWNALATSGFGEGRLPLLDGVRSCIGRGEIGTFQIKASSGSSSSPSSSHSASLSFTVLRLASCHDCRREFKPGEGKTSFRELFRDSVRGTAGDFADDGEGERDERFGAARLRVVRVGADGDVKPRLNCLPGALSCDGCLPALLAVRLECLDFAVLVKSRTEWCADCVCDKLRPPDVMGLEVS
jgi:hypothetical protein